MKKTVFSIIAVVMMAFTAAAQHSGQCGDNLTWNFDEGSRTLTISGTGDMWDNPSFNNCMIANVVIQEGVTSIGDYAFSYKPYLESVAISNTVVSIGDHAFEMCEYLTSITIPNSVITIGEYAFRECGIESPALGNSVSTIGVGAFSNCHLKSLVIPNSLKAIPEFAFYGCTYLETVFFGDSLVSIGTDAFKLCTALTTLEFPSTLQSIGCEAFWDCYSLHSVRFSESLENIGDAAFELCVSLESIEFPNLLSLANIENFAFNKCGNIQEIYCMSDTPPNCLGDNIFDPAAYVYATLYIPIGCESEYKNALTWKNFSNIVETADFTEETAASALRIYPNPAANSLKIEISGSAEIESVSLYDISGRLVKAQQSGFGSIDISGLATGMYVMKVALNDGKVFEEKIVKK